DDHATEDEILLASLTADSQDVAAGLQGLRYAREAFGSNHEIQLRQAKIGKRVRDRISFRRGVRLVGDGLQGERDRRDQTSGGENGNGGDPGTGRDHECLLVRDYIRRFRWFPGPLPVFLQRLYSAAHAARRHQSFGVVSRVMSKARTPRAYII